MTKSFITAGSHIPLILRVITRYFESREKGFLDEDKTGVQSMKPEDSQFLMMINQKLKTNLKKLSIMKNLSIITVEEYTQMKSDLLQGYDKVTNAYKDL